MYSEVSYLAKDHPNHVFMDTLISYVKGIGVTRYVRGRSSRAHRGSGGTTHLGGGHKLFYIVPTRPLEEASTMVI